jgi:hypothetical protein
VKEKVVILKRKTGTQTICPHFGKPITVKVEHKKIKRKDNRNVFEKLGDNMGLRI